jgi:hypothetical protein
MNSVVFASHYSESHPQPHCDDQSHFANSQRWSIKFGEYLHASLRGEEKSLPHIGEYTAWMEKEYTPLEIRLFQKTGGPDATKRAAEKISEINFHLLNDALLPVYETKDLDVDTKDEIIEKRSAISLAQINLGLCALRLYEFREKQIKSGMFYHPSYDQIRRAINGRLAEFDAGIALTDYIKKQHPTATLYAAPAQFEHSPIRSNNADYILTDNTIQQTVGIQVKSHVSTESFNQYDKDKIILIDGSVDLGGQRLVKAAKNETPKLKPWCGMVAVRHLVEASKGERLSYSDAYGLDERYILSRVFAAKALLIGVKSYNRSASKNVGERLSHYFNSQ